MRRHVTPTPNGINFWTKRLAACAGLFAVGSFLIATPAGAPPRASCFDLHAVARPGPIDAGVAAIFLIPNRDGGDFAARLLGDGGTTTELSITRIVAADPNSIPEFYLLAEQRIELGQYFLEYTDEKCAPLGSRIPITIESAPSIPETLGQLSVEYEAFCPGDNQSLTQYEACPILVDPSHIESPILDCPNRTYPPRATIRLELDSALENYRKFMTFDARDDLGSEWTFGYASRLTTKLATIPVNCDIVDNPIRRGHRVLTVFGRLVGGPTIQGRIDCDLGCADCSASPSGSGTAPAVASATPEPALLSGSGGCMVTSLRRGNNAWWVVVVAAMRLRLLTKYPPSSPKLQVGSARRLRARRLV